ncbi:hypothetical protein [Paragemmobacter ruber]|uniref:Uncharacterized protein n=1 Tax=Paragemmobacter ruber TaxID=1985673 RepID=A0ABW9Y5S0_9RHOB|nr:hypothetical protein [Rhodobacter ruber]NBE07758.1 hypothetical protein [Rhodobacter ruber]
MSRQLQSLEQDNGRDLTPEEVAEIAGRLARQHPDVMPLRHCQGRRIPLSFYDDAVLLEFTSDAWLPEGARRCFLDDGDVLRILDGTSPPIHDLNESNPPILTKATALEYLAFFCFFVRGAEGPFLIVDRPDLGFLPPSADRSVLRSLFRPPALHGRDDFGNWRASSVVFYGDCVFFANFHIHLNGMIEMIEDQPLVQDLHFAVTAPLSVDASRRH